MTHLLTLAQAAQTGASTLPPFTWTSWSGDGVLRGGLLFLVGAYLLGIGPLRAAVPPGAARQPEADHRAT